MQDEPTPLPPMKASDHAYAMFEDLQRNWQERWHVLRVLCHIYGELKVLNQNIKK
jgi:hypothetical protein